MPSNGYRADGNCQAASFDPSLKPCKASSFLAFPQPSRESLPLRRRLIRSTLERPRAGRSGRRDEPEAVPLEEIGVVELVGRRHGAREPRAEIRAGNLFGRASE